MMNEEELLEQIEDLRDKADDLEFKADELNWQADELRDKAFELEGDDDNFLKLLDKADKLEDKADKLTERAENLRDKADKLEDQLNDLRYNVEVDDTPKVKPVNRRKIKNEVEEEKWNNIPQRLKKVFENYLEMAQQGSLLAIYEVGNCFYYGVGVEQNIEESLKWYNLAAEGGHSAAINQINEMFLRGESPEMFFAKPLPLKKTSSTFFKPDKKSQDKSVKSSYNGNFSEVDAGLSDLFNDEKSGYEEKTFTFKNSYDKKKYSDTYDSDEDSYDYNDDED
ncbi:MAG: SEL1-like repeat protein [Selenomonadaceae bacterium]|nr:SEL1-like repeat protein [Selenomonadaceae bacterium]